MDIDHIFIFSDDKGKIADELVQFGLSEGSNQRHAGQGTANRKFYFENFFLEIVWVDNEAEIKSELIKPTGLWQRADYKRNGFSPYGLGLVNNGDNDKLFANSFKYQAEYLPEGMTFNILKNESQPHLPLTFQSPFKGKMKHETEPKKHKNGIKKLSKVNFNYKCQINDKYLDNFAGVSSIKFTLSTDYGLTLTFDNNKQGRKKYFEDLKLTFEY